MSEKQDEKNSKRKRTQEDRTKGRPNNFNFVA